MNAIEIHYEVTPEIQVRSQITIDDQSILLDLGVRKTSVPWSQVRRVVETKSFLILLSGRTPLGMIRSEFIGVGTRQYIEEKAASE